MGPSDELQLQAWRAVRRTYTGVGRALDAELDRRTGLSLRAYEVLFLLGRAPGGAMRMSDLAASVLLSPSGMTRLADQLAGRGLIERQQARSDARGQLAVITGAGRTLGRKASGVYQRVVMDHFGHRFTEGQLAAIEEALRGFSAEGSSPAPLPTNPSRRPRGAG